MSGTPQPDPPEGCPRARDGGDGPRRCVFVECRTHARGHTTRGPVSKRARLAIIDDDCVRDVAARAVAYNVQPSYADIGAVLGTSKEAAYATGKRAFLKFTARLSRALAELKRNE